MPIIIDGDASGFKHFMFGGFIQAVSPKGEVACDCQSPNAPMAWPRGGSRCAHAESAAAVWRLGMPDGNWSYYRGG